MKIWSHGALYFLARVGTGMMSLATLAVFTRLLSPREYGLYALGVTASAIFSMILFQWLSIAIGRYFPAFTDRPGILLASSLHGFVLSTAVAILLTLIVLPISSSWGLSRSLALTVLLATVVLGYFNLILQIANAKGLVMRYALLTWTRTAGALVTGYVLVALGGGHLGALFGLVAGHLLAVVVLNPIRGLPFRHSEKSRALSMQLFRYGLPLVFTLLGGIGVDFADRILIGWLQGPSQVGPYAAAYDLSTQCIGAITNVLFLVSFPRVLHAFEHEGNDSARECLHSLGQALVLIGLPVTVGFSIVSTDIANIFLGEAFRGDVVTIMPILASALWLAGFKNYYLDVVFQLKHTTAHQAYIAFAMVVLNVGLNLFLIPRHGVLAAAWATFVAFAVGTILSFGVGRKVMHRRPLMRDFLKTMLACALMAASVLAVPGRVGASLLATKTAIGAVVFALVAWALNAGSARSWLRSHFTETAKPSL